VVQDAEIEIQHPGPISPMITLGSAQGTTNQRARDAAPGEGPVQEQRRHEAEAECSRTAHTTQTRE